MVSRTVGRDDEGTIDPREGMTEAFAEVGEGITLCYEALGSPGDPALMLIMGLGNQLFEWPRPLCLQLVEAGYRVVRFDNRDAGRSTYVDGEIDMVEVVGAIAQLREPDVPYLLSAMARDTTGLMDVLGIERAHVVGMSLGGMVAQQLAIDASDRVASLTSIASRTGDPSTGVPSDRGLEALLAPPARTREEAIERALKNAEVWGSEGASPEDIRAVQLAKWDRHYDPAGTARQLAAVLASPNRDDGLSRLEMPVLALHGTRDEFMQPDGSTHLAEVVPAAEVRLIEGMGHDLTRWTWPHLVEAIVSHTDKAAALDNR
jgi:pimeloyl-ACP methyl ester carboxylesterase